VNSRLPADWQDRVINDAENMALMLGGVRPAVKLDGIARRRKVHEVVFRPMLIAGGLALRDDGFVVYVKCDKQRAAVFHDDLVSNGGLGLPPRHRFTIAHEIVHTLLYDLECRPPVALLKATAEETFEKLESTCNEGAARVLLPTNRLRDLFANTHFFEPDTIRDFIRQSAVSLETFVIRCNSIDWGSSFGAIAVIRLREGRPVVECSARAKLTKQLFGDLHHHSELPPSVFEHIEQVRCGKVEDELRVPSGGRVLVTGRTLRWLRVGSNPRRWLLTFQLDEYPR
jgi:hypothetical protein